MVQCWRGNDTSLHMHVLRWTLTLSEWRCKEAPVINKEGCSAIRDNQTIGATNSEKWFEFVSIQNDSGA
jgi:hypothetical protein